MHALDEVPLVRVDVIALHGRQVVVVVVTAHHVDALVQHAHTCLQGTAKLVMSLQQVFVVALTRTCTTARRVHGSNKAPLVVLRVVTLDRLQSVDAVEAAHREQQPVDGDDARADTS